MVRARLRRLGMDQSRIEMILSGRTKRFSPLTEALLAKEVVDAGCQQPQLLL